MYEIKKKIKKKLEKLEKLTFATHMQIITVII